MTTKDGADRVMLLEHIEVTKQHVAQSELYIAQQQMLIDRLRWQGRPIDPAQMFLEALENVLAAQVSHCALLEQELRSIDGVGGT